MKRRVVVAIALAVAMTAALLGGSGGQSSAALAYGRHAMPAGLAASIHALLGAGQITSGAASHAQVGPAAFGFAVALSADGTTALVGAPHVHGQKGAAYVFHSSGAGSWSSSHVPAAALTPPSSPASQLFGFDVALSADGTTAFVGAPGLGEGTAGVIFVFHAASEDAWASSATPTTTLTDPGAQQLGFVLAVSPDGTTLISGDPNADAAFVFHVASEDAWASITTPTATLSNVNQSSSDGGAGFSVAISGDGTTALVSDAFNPSGGGAWLYHVASANAWVSSGTPTATLADENGAPGDYLGFGLALSGDGTVAFVGAPADSHKTRPGYVDVYHSAGEGSWSSTSTPTATLTQAGASKRDDFGFKVAVSSDGTTALVTSPRVLAPAHAPYVAFVYHVASEGAWVSTSAPTATLTGSRGRTGGGYDLQRDGGALSADGGTALLGAPGALLGTGATDVFHVADATAWPAKSSPAAVLTDSALLDCAVPNLHGLKVRAAKAALKAGRCGVGRVVKVNGKPGRVVWQTAAPGSRLPRGTKVRIGVGK